MKKLLAILLSMTLLFSCIGTVSFADTGEGDGATSVASNDVKKTYIKLSLKTYKNGDDIFFGFSSTEDSRGKLTLYGVADKEAAANWESGSVTYKSAPANDPYSNSVDITKVYGEQALATYIVAGAANYAVNLKDYANAMLEQGAEYMTLIFVVDNDTDGVGNVTIIPREGTETNFVRRKSLDDWTVGYTYDTEVDGKKPLTATGGNATDERRNNAPALGKTSGEVIEGGWGASGNSFRVTMTGTDDGVKFRGLFDDLSANAIGREINISFKTKMTSLPEGVQSVSFKYGLTSGSGTQYTADGTRNSKYDMYPTENVGVITEDMLNQWITWTMDVTIDEFMTIKESGDTSGLGWFTVRSNYKGTFEMVIDEIVSTETVSVSPYAEVEPIIYSQDFETVTNKAYVTTTANLSQYWATEKGSNPAYNWHQSNNLDTEVTYDESTQGFKVRTYQSDYRLGFYLFDKASSSDSPTNLFQTGKRYEISFWINSNLTGSFDIGLNKTNENGRLGESRIVDPKTTTVNRGDTWVRCTYQFTADETTSNMNAMEIRPSGFEGLKTSTALQKGTSKENAVDLTAITPITFYIDNLVCREIVDVWKGNTPLDQVSVGDGLKTTDILTASSAIGGLVGNSLALQGDIAVSFYMWIDDAYQNSETAYINCQLPNGTVKKITLDQLTDTYVSVGDKQISCYRFVANVAAKEMADQITVQLFTEKDAQGGYTYKYTVQDYAKVILGSSGNPTYDTAKGLVTDLLNYGMYAQMYFNHRTNNPANAGYAWEASKLDAVTKDSLGSYKNNLWLGDANVKLAGTSLVLNSNTTLQLYFTVKNGVNDVIFRYGGEELTSTTSDGYTCVEITDIAANNLDANYTIDISYGDGQATAVTYNCMAYAYDVLCQKTDEKKYTVALQNLVKALYLYNQAADTYYAAVREDEPTGSVIALDNSKAISLLGNYVAMAIKSDEIYYNSSKHDAGACAYMNDDTPMFPARALAQALGLSYSVSGSQVTMSGTTVAAEEMNAQYYISLEGVKTIATNLEKTVIYEERGFVVIGDGSFTSNGDERKEVLHYLLYDRPTVHDIKDIMDSKQTHPSVVLNSDMLTKLLKKYKDDTTVKQWGDDIIRRANERLNMAVPTYTLSSDGTLLTVSRRVYKDAQYFSMAYLLTKDVKYANKLYEVYETAGNFQDWHEAHFLDTAEMMMAFSIGYDWLYDVWTPEQRDFLSTAIYAKGLTPAYQICYGTYPDYESTWWVYANNNWGAVCNGSILSASVAIYDRYPELCADMAAYSIRGIEYMMDEFYPSGAWSEGPIYWAYLMGYLENMISTMDATMGTDFGISKAPAFESTVDYYVAVNGPVGQNNYHDSEDSNLTAGHTLYWLADKLNLPYMAGIRRAQIDNKKDEPEIWDLIYYATPSGTTQQDVKLDYYLKELELVSLRGHLEDIHSAWVSFHAGESSTNHGHLDTGSYVVDMLGERWAIDLGSDDYSLDGYDVANRMKTYTIYRKRPEGHNLYVINPASDINYPGQTVDNFTKIEKYETKSNGAFAIIDLTEAYKRDVSAAKRGYMIGDGRESIVIRDEISLHGTDNTFYWFNHLNANTTAEVIDKNTVKLTQNGKVLKLMVETNLTDYEVSIADAKPLECSPQVDGQNPNTGMKKIKITSEKASGDVWLQVKFVPWDSEMANQSFANISLEQWAIK